MEVGAEVLPTTIKDRDMPNWKKVITSGSNADLNQLKLSGISNAGTDTDKFLVLDNRY